MTQDSFEIVPFQDKHQDGIDLLMESISKEFSENIFSPTAKSIKEVSRLPDHRCWVACFDNTVIGTVGFYVNGNSNIEY